MARASLAQRTQRAQDCWDRGHPGTCISDMRVGIFHLRLQRNSFEKFSPNEFHACTQSDVLHAGRRAPPAA